VRYEIILVDNNSTDQTRSFCESYAATCPVPIRYIFEPRQGVSYARNTGITVARAPILAFTDDDITVSSNWIQSIKRAFDEHPDVYGIGGKVIPEGDFALPKWLTRDQWYPLAIQDYGNSPLRMNAENPLGLVSANLALRRAAFERIGLFSIALQRIKDGIGSAEDHDLHLRLYEAGLEELYLPEIVVTTEVQPERLTRAYHRRWHRGNGHFCALMRDPQIEQSVARLFDVPAYLYKQTLIDVLGWLRYTLAGNSREAFLRETRICFFMGFFRSRLSTYRKAGYPGILQEIASFLNALLRPVSGKRFGKSFKEP
jgi:glycosyltransferase involved in cell wall biosynthesis